MRGKHSVIIETERLKYQFEIRRNITVIQGDSATGKTTLVDLIQTYGRYGQGSGIRIDSDVPCIAFAGDAGLLKTVPGTYENSIVFIDEDHPFIFSNDFAEIIRSTSNYYVLITRQPLKNLPYSINEIYGIRTTGRYHFPDKIYHEFYPLYRDNVLDKLKDTVFLVEDEKSGYQFFHHICGNLECVSSTGNSGIVTQLDKMSPDKQVIVIADGAAFGAYIAQVMAIVRRRSDVCMYFPESFEWLILKAGILKIKDIDDILAHPEDFIDSGVFFSWERFFTDVLESNTRDDSIRRYDKGKLNDFYLEGKNKDAIINVLPEELRMLCNYSEQLRKLC